jgi:hypothetical protein
MKWTKFANSKWPDLATVAVVLTVTSYENVLGFHRFWSVDDKQICT